MPILVERLPIALTPDPSRMITRLFFPGDIKRAREIVERALSVPEDEIERLVSELERSFVGRHPDLRVVFAEHYDRIRFDIGVDRSTSEARRLFIGACFTMEYAIESVALCNPSIVPAFRQEGVPPGGVRFLMSLRATGEGHLSSIVFRTGVIDAKGEVRLDAPGTYSQSLRATLPDLFRKSTLSRNIVALSVPEKCVQPILDRLGERFTREELSKAIDAVRRESQTSGFLESAADTLISLTRLNYQLHLSNPAAQSQSEFVIFPFSDIERQGMEDLRLVHFTENDRSTIDYGTFTAFNGKRGFSQLMEFHGESSIEVSLITGECARNKGMALFPRRMHGKYAMVARIDNESLYYMESDDILAWDDARKIQAPKFPWQIILIGNCGSPIETDAGWLLLTHGVGPMRRYSIGATLLDRDDPCRVIGQTREPLITATDAESAGYVPNVVYSCGAMVHNGQLFLPYALSDRTTTMARVDLGSLIRSLVEP
jgi:predicted GH43/DUF377 family glycosyl hydrolase